MKVLHLTLKKKWFDMIASGEKKEEYRDIKPYWMARLVEKGYWEFHGSKAINTVELNSPYGEKTLFDAIQRNYEFVHLKNGYGAAAPLLKIECKDIEISTGNPEWGAEPGKEYFVIKLGEIIK